MCWVLPAYSGWIEWIYIASGWSNIILNEMNSIYTIAIYNFAHHRILTCRIELIFKNVFPGLVCIVANLLFFINIFRILMTKLRAPQSNEPVHYR